MDIEKIGRLILYDSTIVTSSAMRQFFENNPPFFSDVDLAAIVGNCSAPKDKKIELLSGIASETEDASLKAKIEKWICCYRLLQCCYTCHEMSQIVYFQMIFNVL